MKHFFLFALAFLFVVDLNAQVAIAPFVVYINPATRYGEYQVINNNTYDTDVEITLKFAYPTTDSLGKVTFKWEDTTNVQWSKWDMSENIKAFPRRFVLKPNQTQKVKFLMRLPSDAPNGMYWTRIVTKSAPKLKAIDTTDDGKTARASLLIITQYTNLIVYQKGKVETNVSVEGTEYYQDSTYINLLLKLHQWCEFPAWCNIHFKILEESGAEFYSFDDVAAVYNDAVKKVRIEKKKLKPGQKYTIEYDVTSDRTDIPKEMHTLFPPFKGKTEFIYRAD